MADSDEVILSSLALIRDMETAEERDFSLQILHGTDDSSTDASSSIAGPQREMGPTTRGYSAKLFESALNSSDPKTLAEIFVTFMDPEVYMDAYCVESPGCLDSEENLEVRVVGLENLISYFAAYIVAIPDSIFLIHEWKVFERRNGQSCVVFRYSLSGNQILPHDQRCHIRELAKVPMPTLVGRKRKIETSHSIKFKDTAKGHSTLSEQLRRQRVRTLGEFVADNRCLPQHKPNIRQLQMESSLAPLPMPSFTNNATTAGEPISPYFVSEASDRTMGDSGSTMGTGDGAHKTPNTVDIDSDVSDDNDSFGSDSDGVDVIRRRSKKVSIPTSDIPMFLLLTDALTVNVRGVMRFHVSEDGYVKRIHCSHFAKFNN